MLARIIPVVLVAATGCTFYTDGINGEPKAQIVKETSGPHYLGDPVELGAYTSRDPNNSRDELTARWQVFRCNDVQGSDCPEELDLVEDPLLTNYILSVTTKQPILVELTVLDQRGASDTDRLVVEVGNRPPSLVLQRQGYQIDGGFPHGTWIDVLAVADDADSDPVELEWELFPPDDSVAADLQWAPVTGFGVPAYRLVPDVVGLYNVRVTATDGDGGRTREEIPVLVVEDAPPCIATIEPAVPGGGYIVDAGDEPRRFAALSVVDDLDPFPAPADPGDFLGEAGFRWLLATPDTGGSFVEVTGHTVSDYLLDPAGFAPGDQLAVRVEIADRVDRLIDCDDADDTCSIDGDSCLQRVTWGVEIR